MSYQQVQDRTAALIARGTALHARGTALHADLAALMEHSRLLLAQGRARRLTSTYPRLRLIRGGSDVALVTATIADARICLHCIARKTGVPAEQVSSLLTVVARTLRLGIGPHRCDACLQHKTTFSIVTMDGQP